jgi:hypothetical protein
MHPCDRIACVESNDDAPSRGGKKNERIAGLSHDYGFYVGGLTWEQQLGLELNLPRIQARKTIESGNYDPHDWDAVYDLWLDAYDDEQSADAARLKSMYMVMRKETEAARVLAKVDHGNH